jgi:hypothetical protein
MLEEKPKMLSMKAHRMYYLALAFLLFLFPNCSMITTPMRRVSEVSSSGLTNAKVELAVTKLISAYRLGGSVNVDGIQELPQQNSAIADLTFNGFEYPVTHDGRLIQAEDFKPSSIPERRNPGDPLPSMEQMFPPRKLSYSGNGQGILTRYNDGSWVLKEVRWGRSFDTSGVSGTIPID